MSNPHELSEYQMAPLRPYFPKSGLAGCNGRRVPSSSIFIKRNRLRLCDALNRCGLPQGTSRGLLHASKWGGVAVCSGGPRTLWTRSHMTQPTKLDS